MTVVGTVPAGGQRRTPCADHARRSSFVPAVRSSSGASRCSTRSVTVVVAALSATTTRPIGCWAATALGIGAHRAGRGPGGYGGGGARCRAAASSRGAGALPGGTRARIDGAIAAILMTDTVKEVAWTARAARSTAQRSGRSRRPRSSRPTSSGALERDAAALAAATDDAWLVDDAGGVITVVESSRTSRSREVDPHVAPC